MASSSLKAVQQFRQQVYRIWANSSSPVKQTVSPSSSQLPSLPNPFLPRKNPVGQWIPPKYSLRQQADLVKHAKASNTLHFLPPGPKLLNPTQEAFNRYAQSLGVDPTTLKKAIRQKLTSELLEKPLPGIAAKDPAMQQVTWQGEYNRQPKPGADLGTRLYAAKKKMFKGHRHERLAVRKMVYRRILLRDMNRRIRDFKEFRRKRMPNPLSEPRSTARSKMPF